MNYFISLQRKKRKDMNKVMLIGNVGRDPEVKYVDAGVCVASVRLATTERGYTLQNGTEVPERTEWHNVVLWRKLAEVVEKYVHKGDKLFIEGQIHTRTYDDQNGIRRTVTEIWAESLEMLSPKPQTPEQPQNQ
jgi:single-strand DNA-binding protein